MAWLHRILFPSHGIAPQASLVPRPLHLTAPPFASPYCYAALHFSPPLHCCASPGAASPRAPTSLLRGTGPALRDMKAQWGSIIPDTTNTWVENGDCNNHGSFDHLSCDGSGFVTRLDLSSNYLTGALPETIGGFNKLLYFYIDSNSLSGPLPSNFSKLVSLREFDAHSNKISGPLPDGIGALTALQQLYLYNNQLEGPIPASFTQLTALTLIELQYNQITGPLPGNLGSVSQLIALRAYNNHISGPVPPTLTATTNLRFIELGSNDLSGTIPTNVATITTLQTLDLSHNEISGPFQITGMHRLFT
ncbi:unnamed protein product, partial [Closterium sp. Yama58-4]